MNLLKRAALLICIVFIIQKVCPASAVGYIPWDELSKDSWIQFLGGNDPNMYPVNAADNNDVETLYPISFLQVDSNIKARGMNALKFIHGGLMEGHLVSKDKAGKFIVTNTGNSNFFSDILLLIAINANSLTSDFLMTINLAGQTPYVLDANDFVYYDNQYGRPSGFYAVTDPNVEPISYAFDTAMVTVYGVSGLTALEPTDPLHPEYENKMTVEYSFDYVPAPVVFSVYGYVSNVDDPSIYHTNRAFIDTRNPSKKISTFAVTVDGDLNGDLKVDFLDFAVMSKNWLVGAK
jgi:hypothetical protein